MTGDNLYESKYQLNIAGSLSFSKLGFLVFVSGGIESLTSVSKKWIKITKRGYSNGKINQIIWHDLPPKSKILLNTDKLK